MQLAGTKTPLAPPFRSHNDMRVTRFWGATEGNIMLKKIAIGVGVTLSILVTVIALQPSSYAIKRSLVINASPAAVYAEVADFNSFSAWSPWEELDPNLKTTITGAPNTVGHKYVWKGNDDVGHGEMTVVATKPTERVDIDLNFIAPFASQAKTYFLVSPQGDGTNVTWGMTGENDFMGKAFGLVMNMDEMIGKDYEKGLAKLKAKMKG